jgi:hypothetical protein
MTRERETHGRGVLPGVQGKQAARGAAFDGLWNGVLVGTEASAKGRLRFRLHRGSPLWVAAFERRPRLHLPRHDDDQDLRRDPNAPRLHQAVACPLVLKPCGAPGVRRQSGKRRELTGDSANERIT